MDEEGDLDDLTRETVRVPPLVFLSELVSVIRAENDDAVVVSSRLLEEFHESAEARVDPLHPRRIGSVKAGIGLALRNGVPFAVDRRDVQVLRQRVGEDR